MRHREGQALAREVKAGGQGPNLLAEYSRVSDASWRVL